MQLTLLMCNCLQHQTLEDFWLLEIGRRKQTSQKLEVDRDFRQTCVQPKLLITYICIPLLGFFCEGIFLFCFQSLTPVSHTYPPPCAARPQRCGQEGGNMEVPDDNSALCCRGQRGRPRAQWAPGSVLCRGGCSKLRGLEELHLAFCRVGNSTAPTAGALSTPVFPNKRQGCYYSPEPG